MTRESKLYPALIQAQCQSAIAILQADNEKLLATSASVSAFVEDKEIVSVSFDQLKQQCSNYIDVINSIIEVNNMDIADYQTLSSAVGSEVLEGDVIITNQETYARLRNGAYERESIYRRKAACDMDPGLRALHYGMAEASHSVGDFYEEQYQYWLGKELLYDSIEASTSGLFTLSGAMRSAVGELVSALSQSFHLSTGYNPSGMTVIRLQIARIKQGERDMANGIKALEEYLIESGKYTLEERNAIINSIVDQTPERLRELPNIIAIAGTEAGKANIKTLISIPNIKSMIWAKRIEKAELKCSENQKKALIFVGEELLKEGFDDRFVAGVLGNILNEGDFGEFESSAYKEDNPNYPVHLRVVDEKCDYRECFSGKNIQEVGIDKTELLCEEAKNYGGGFGLGCVQWSFSRTEDLLECYKIVCASDLPTEEECYKAEVMLIKQELTGSFSGVYDKWLGEKSEDIETSIKDASNIIFSDYEKPGTNDKEERANDAWILYQIVEENKCYE